jgi:hypothetical protein
MADLELEAMGVVYEALAGLDEEARARVVAWAVGKFDVAEPARTAGTGPPSVTGDSHEVPRFADVADLVHAARPQGGPEHALAVAYWIQRVEGQDGWAGAQINDQLKNLGHAQTNITATLSRLIKRKPSLVVQTAKTGRSQQARKTYKLTAAGLRVVEQMLTTGEEAA